MFQSVCTVRLKTSSTHDNWQHFPLEAVDGRAAYYCLGKAVPKSDVVRKERSSINLGSEKRYKVVESVASNRAYWFEVSGWHVN